MSKKTDLDSEFINIFKQGLNFQLDGEDDESNKEEIIRNLG